MRKLPRYTPHAVPPRRVQIQRLALAAAFATTLYAGGTILYHRILHDSVFDAFYHVAWGSVLHPVDPPVRTTRLEILDLAVGIAGLCFFSYLLANAIEIVYAKLSAEARYRHRVAREMRNLKNHYIICGYGRVGRRAAQEFTASDESFVVLDIDETVCEAARADGILAVHGNAHEDATLIKAGIHTARGLIATADSDTQNLYITLSARTLCRDLLIIARAGNAEAEEKLRLVGADRVVQPFAVAGVEVANIALKPQLASFLDLVSSHRGGDLRFEQLLVDARAPAANKPIREIWATEDSRALIVAIHGPGDVLDANPLATTVLPPGVTVIALGTEAQLRVLAERLVEPGKASGRPAPNVAPAVQPQTG